MSRSIPAVVRRALIAFWLVAAPAAAADAPPRDIRLEIPVIPELQRYEALLMYPAYVLAVLDNNGLSPSLSRRPVLKDARTVELGDAVMRFVGKSGTVYRYEAGASIDLGVVVTELTFPVSVDVAGFREGRLVVRLSPPLSGLFPAPFLQRVQLKAQLLADVQSQLKVHAYLERLSESRPEARDVTALFEPILLDAYNRYASAPGGRVQDGGGALAWVPDQWIFLVALVAWIAVLAWTARRRRPSPQARDD